MSNPNRMMISAYIIHCGLNLAFTIFGSSYEVAIVAPLSCYAVALISAYSVLHGRQVFNSPRVAKRLLALHFAVSFLLLLIGVFAEETVPLIGGALTYIALMVFYIVNYPGSPVSNLLPYPGSPEIVWEALRYAAYISTTAIWLYAAFRLSSVPSKKSGRNA